MVDCLMERDEDQPGILVCRVCKVPTVRPTTVEPEAYHRTCGAVEAPPTWLSNGVGSKFDGLMKRLDITAPEGCSCYRLMLEMNWDGVAGCRANRDKYIKRIKANLKKWKWDDKLKAVTKAAWNAIKTGLYVDPRDPIPGLFDEAIRLQELEEAESIR